MAVWLNSTKLVRLALFGQTAVGFVDGNHFTINDSDEQSRLSEAFKTIQLGVRSKNKGVALVLDNQSVRIFACYWDASLRTPQDFFRYAEIEFERRFHNFAKDWTLVPDKLHPGGVTLWCAYQPEQLKMFETAASNVGLKIQSCMASAVAEVALLNLPRIGSVAIYVSESEQSKSICWIEDGRISDMLVLSRQTEIDQALVDIFIARRKRSQMQTNDESILVMRTQGSRIDTLKRIVAWQPPIVVTTSFEMSPMTQMSNEAAVS
jgi:hypothetical protein